MTNDEIARLARGYAIEFCRTHGVSEQDSDDYINEGVLQALEFCAGKPEVRRSFVRHIVRGRIMDYHKKWANGGIGGKDALSPEYVYLSEPVGGDGEDGDDASEAGDAISYERPPVGYRQTDEEAASSAARGRINAILPLLDEDDRELLWLRYYREMTQQEVAILWDVTQQAVAKRERAALARAKKLLVVKT